MSEFTYRALPEPSLEVLEAAFAARDGEVLGRQLVALSLATRDSVPVLGLALRAIRELDDAFVAACAIEAIEHVHWFGAGLVTVHAVNEALATTTDAVRDDRLVRSKLDSLCEVFNDKAAACGEPVRYERVAHQLRPV
jgi:hypothetical protein